MGTEVGPAEGVHCSVAMAKVPSSRLGRRASGELERPTAGEAVSTARARKRCGRGKGWEAVEAKGYCSSLLRYEYSLSACDHVAMVAREREAGGSSMSGSESVHKGEAMVDKDKGGERWGKHVVSIQEISVQLGV